MAGAWAAKEAFSKALHTGVTGFSLDEITVMHGENGEPYLLLSGNAAKAAEGLTVHISISHIKEFAQASASSKKKAQLAAAEKAWRIIQNDDSTDSVAAPNGANSPSASGEANADHAA